LVAQQRKDAKLIKDSVKANFIMLRIWGGGYYPDDDFYDLCDENGIILWLDLCLPRGSMI
jgi:beta-mannosidase